MQLSVGRGPLTLKFDLVEHPMGEQPTSPAQYVGYVRFPGSATLKAARWCKGGWHDHRRQPFPDTPEAWFSVELPNRG